MSRPAETWLMPTAAATGSPSTSMTLHHGDAGIGHHGARGVGMLQPRHDQARGSPGQHLVDHVFLVRGVVFRGAHDRLKRRVVEEPSRCRAARRGTPCSTATGSRRPRGSHGSRPARRRSCLVRSRGCARRRRRGRGSFSDTSPRCRKDAAYGHFRHARRFGNVAKRHLRLAVEGIASAQIWGSGTGALQT